MLCELIGTIVVLKTLALILLVRVSAFMKELMVFYLRLISAFLFCWWWPIHSQSFDKQTCIPTNTQQENEWSVFHVALRYRLKRYLICNFLNTDMTYLWSYWHKMERYSQPHSCLTHWPQWWTHLCLWEWKLHPPQFPIEEGQMRGNGKLLRATGNRRHTCKIHSRVT